MHDARCSMQRMKYKSKGYVFDEEVTAWLEKLKAIHGSYNKGLRLVAFAAEGFSAIPSGVKDNELDVPRIAPFTTPKPELQIQLNGEAVRSSLDAVPPGTNPTQGKATTETFQRGIRPKGDTKR